MIEQIEDFVFMVTMLGYPKSFLGASDSQYSLVSSFDADRSKVLTVEDGK